MGELDPVRLDEDLRALLSGKIHADGTRHGSMWGHRVAVRNESRRRCQCGCGGLRNWTGLGDGVALMSGCKAAVEHWVGDPIGYINERRRRNNG